MPYAFDPAEPVADAMRRIAVEQLTLATSLLRNDEAEGSDERIHEARKSMKRLRALLRLGRFALPRASFVREDAVYRDAARMLSGVRAATAAHQRFEELMCVPRTGLGAESVEFARHRLESVCAEHRATASAPLRKALEGLEAALPRVTGWRCKSSGWSALAPGLRAVYAQGQRGKKRAFAAGTTESFHDWRKQVKYLWNSLRLLEPCWPRGLKGLTGELDLLGETVGHDHDLADIERLLSESTQANEVELMTPVLLAARARRAALREAADRSAQRVFVETPKAFTKRLGSYFDSWCEESRSISHAHPE